MPRALRFAYETPKREECATVEPAVVLPKVDMPVQEKLEKPLAGRGNGTRVSNGFVTVQHEVKCRNHYSVTWCH